MLFRSNLGILAATMFDEVIIRHDKDMRGRSENEVTSLLIDGINQTNRNVSILVISDECKAIEHAINHAQHGEFIMICTDAINESIQYVKQRLEEEKQNKELIHI